VTDAAGTVLVIIEKLVAGGAGLARTPDGVVLVEDTAPGDELTVRVTGARRGVRRGRPERLIAAGPGRREPTCRYVGSCGGCDWQHLTYAAQLEAKVDILHESMRRIGRVVAPAPIRVHRSPPWRYRRRARLHPAGDAGGVGFHARRSRGVVALESCPVLTEGLESLLSAPHEVAFDSAWHALDTGHGVLGAAAGWGHVDVDGGELAVTASSFFQANGPLLEPLVGRVIGLAGRGRRAIDLYAGVGLFAVALAARFDVVDAVEWGRDESAALARNARGRSGSVRVHRAAAERFVAREEAALADAVVVVDPPRDGLSATVRSALVSTPPERLIYVACDPVTGARDLGALVGAGMTLESLDLFDLFPQTHHFEIVAALARPALS